MSIKKLTKEAISNVSGGEIIKDWYLDTPSTYYVVSDDRYDREFLAGPFSNFDQAKNAAINFGVIPYICDPFQKDMTLWDE